MFISNIARGNVIVKLLQNTLGIRFAEVGVKQGRTCAYVAGQCPGVHVVAVDPFKPVPNDVDDYATWDFKQIRREFNENVREFAERVLVLEMLSVEAAEECTRRELPIDVVFIDAAHDYDNVMADISAWWPLVRPKGFLAGHDFNPHSFPEVCRAVQDHFPPARINVHDNYVWAVRKC